MQKQHQGFPSVSFGNIVKFMSRFSCDVMMFTKRWILKTIWNCRNHCICKYLNLRCLWNENLLSIFLLDHLRSQNNFFCRIFVNNTTCEITSHNMTFEKLHLLIEVVKLFQINEDWSIITYSHGSSVSVIISCYMIKICKPFHQIRNGQLHVYLLSYW